MGGEARRPQGHLPPFLHRDVTRTAYGDQQLVGRKVSDTRTCPLDFRRASRNTQGHSRAQGPVDFNKHKSRDRALSSRSFRKERRRFSKRMRQGRAPGGMSLLPAPATSALSQIPKTHADPGVNVPFPAMSRPRFAGVTKDLPGRVGRYRHQQGWGCQDTHRRRFLSRETPVLLRRAEKGPRGPRP